MPIDKQGLTPESAAVEEIVQAIKRWERAILHARSKAEQVSDWIAITAGSGPVLVLHVDRRVRQRIANEARLSICILPSCARDRTALVVAKRRSDS